MAATHAHTSSSSGTCSRLLRSDIFSLRLRVPFTFYDRSSGALSLSEILPTGIRRPPAEGKREGNEKTIAAVERGTPKTTPWDSAAAIYESLDTCASCAQGCPRCTRRSIDFGGRDRRRFLATTKIHASLRTLLSFSETIARFAGEFRREGARRRWKLKAIRVGRVSQARSVAA